MQTDLLSCLDEHQQSRSSTLNDDFNNCDILIKSKQPTIEITDDVDQENHDITETKEAKEIKDSPSSKKTLDGKISTLLNVPFKDYQGHHKKTNNSISSSQHLSKT